MKSAYDILGVSSDSSDDQIRDAYLRHAKALHPDHNKRPTAETEFKELNSAYSKLKDSLLRREHDYELAKAGNSDVPDDDTDDMLKRYDVDKPKKKKKKKKKKSVEVQQAVAQSAPYIPPQRGYEDFDGGRADYEGIPPGYGADDSCGGMF